MKALAHPIRIFWVDLIAINYLSVSGERSSSNGCLYCFKAFNPAETGLNIDRPEDGIRVLYSLICPCIWNLSTVLMMKSNRMLRRGLLVFCLVQKNLGKFHNPNCFLLLANTVPSAQAANSRTQGAVRVYSTFVPDLESSTSPAIFNWDKCFDAADFGIPASSASSQTHHGFCFNFSRNKILIG